MTTSKVTIIALMALFAEAICAPEARAAARVGAKAASPANISFNELLYILDVRSGEEPRTPKVLSPCARAILGCCRNEVMDGYCSEALSCGAFFFDVNPCGDNYVIDALSAAKAFYEQFNSVS